MKKLLILLGLLGVCALLTSCGEDGYGGPQSPGRTPPSGPPPQFHFQPAKKCEDENLDWGEEHRPHYVS